MDEAAALGEVSPKRSAALGISAMVVPLRLRLLVGRCGLGSEIVRQFRVTLSE